MRLSLSFDYQKTRIFPIDQPEILIPALLVVGTKICFPFSSEQKSLLPAVKDLGLAFDWQKWIELKGNYAEQHKTLDADDQFREVSLEQVMDHGQLDDFLRYMASQINLRSESVNETFPYLYRQH